MGKRKTYVFVVLLLLIAFIADAKADYATTLTFNGYIQSGAVDIDVDVWSAPLANDWNSDGKIDLLVGQKNSVTDVGSISYYNNTSTIYGPPSFNSSATILACSNACVLNVLGSG